MTLRYGNTRDLVLGIEAVLPDGRIWNGLSRLRKNNTGFDLKHLFIGGEGSLGVITAAVVKLFPRPVETETVFLAVVDPQSAITLLSRLREATGDAVVGFELIPRFGLDLALRHIPRTTDPLVMQSPWYVLIEATTGMAGRTLRTALEAELAKALENGLITDAAIAETESQRQAFWFIREAIVEAQTREGGSIKHDVSVPVSQVANFIARATEAVSALMPGIRPMPFGHVGDGNIHFNLTEPVGADRADFLAQWDRINRVVHDIALSLDGSISAEHGIGRFKRDEMRRMKSPVELDMMRRIKTALDPQSLMNPGVMLPTREGD